jgi:hypothetical protein
VVCGAELGLTGLFFWSCFLFPSLKDVLATASETAVTEGKAPLVAPDMYVYGGRKPPLIDKAEINRIGRLLVLSFTGFLVAGMFLSRAFVMTIFLLGGIGEVVYELAREREMVAPRWTFGKVAPYAGAMAIGLVIVMYIFVRLSNLTH